MWAFGCGVVASGQSLDGRLGLVAAEALPFMDPEFSDTPEATEQLNEASRAAFAAWLHAERLVADGSATVPRGTRKPSPRRKR